MMMAMMVMMVMMVMMMMVKAKNNYIWQQESNMMAVYDCTLSCNDDDSGHHHISRCHH